MSFWLRVIDAIRKVHDVNVNIKNDSPISSAKARAIVRRAAVDLGCTVRELKRAVAGISTIPSTLIRQSLERTAKEAGCTVEDVRLALIDAGTDHRGTITSDKARRLFAELHSVERVALATGCPIDEVRRVLQAPDRRGRRPRLYNPAERARLLQILKKHGSTRLAAKACGLSQSTFLRRIREPESRGR